MQNHSPCHKVLQPDHPSLKDDVPNKWSAAYITTWAQQLDEAIQDSACEILKHGLLTSSHSLPRSQHHHTRAHPHTSHGTVTHHSPCSLHRPGRSHLCPWTPPPHRLICFPFQCSSVSTMATQRTLDTNNITTIVALALDTCICERALPIFNRYGGLGLDPNSLRRSAMPPSPSSSTPGSSSITPSWTTPRSTSPTTGTWTTASSPSTRTFSPTSPSKLSSARTSLATPWNWNQWMTCTYSASMSTSTSAPSPTSHPTHLGKYKTMLPRFRRFPTTSIVRTLITSPPDSQIHLPDLGN